jgi:hypothetical protein
LSTNPFSDSNDPFGKPPPHNPYASPAPVYGGSTIEQAREQLKIPAIILIVLGVLSELHRFASLSFYFFVVQQQQGAVQTPQMVGGLAGDIGGIVLNIAVIVGAVCMLKMNSKAGAWAGAIASVIPCVGPCCVLGIPFGIWAMVLLSKPEVANAFEK